MPDLSPKQQKDIELAKAGICLAGTWKSMVSRCTVSTSPNYHRYGGRGIRIEWKSFDDFLADMLPTYDKNKSLDRIDNDGNYSLSNCRWATPKEQANNTSRNRRISYSGLELTLGQWGERIGVHSSTLRNRIDLYGWSLKKALTTPLYSKERADACKRNHIRTEDSIYTTTKGYSVCRACNNETRKIRKQRLEAQIA